MVLKIADVRSPDSQASRFRRRRMSLVLDLIGRFPGPVRVLDVGGSPNSWLPEVGRLPSHCHITFLNLHPVSVSSLPGASSIVGDARNLVGLGNGSFDVCFSNSVIEHVGTLYDQMAMASEVRRVGRAYFVQTPNLHFPLEPHFLVPAWQYLPVWLRAAIYRRWNLGWMPRQRDWLLARAEVEQVRLVTRSEMTRLFPDAQIVCERIGPLIKGFIAIRTDAPPSPS